MNRHLEMKATSKWELFFSRRKRVSPAFSPVRSPHVCADVAVVAVAVVADVEVLRLSLGTRIISSSSLCRIPTRRRPRRRRRRRQKRSSGFIGRAKGRGNIPIEVNIACVECSRNVGAEREREGANEFKSTLANPSLPAFKLG